MKRTLVASFVVLSVLLVAVAAEAARVRVVRRPYRRTTVVVHAGFPLNRAFPHVFVRAPLVAFRVAPRLFLPPVVFGAVVVAAPAPAVRVWRDAADLDRDDDWTEFTMNVDKRGSKLLLEVDKGPAQISFAEVVFDNGETQVVDFADKLHPQGIYSLLDFKEGRKVDHVRIVAKAAGDSTAISLHLLT